MDVYDLIDSIDIVEYISKYVDLEEKNGELWGLSPFKKEKTPSFSVRRENKSWYDFSSGYGGNVVTFVKLIDKCSGRDAVEKLKSYAGFSESDDVSPKLSATTLCKMYSRGSIGKYTRSDGEMRAQKRDFTVTLPADYMDRFEDRPEMYELWRKDGISDEAMKEFGVKYDGYTNRIVYPIYSRDGTLVNVGGRTLDPDFKEHKLNKYMYFKGWGGQMSLIYGLNHNEQYVKEKKQIILFEGMKSVLVAWDYGFRNTGAILTSHLNPGQMKILASLGVRIVFALDKDVDISKDHNINKLKSYANIEYLHDEDGLIGDKDSPVDRGRETFVKLLESRHKF